MRSLTLFATLPLVLATPAFAQHEGHTPPPAAQPAAAPTQAPPEDAADAMEAMDWPTEVPSGQSGQDGMAGMDHGAQVEEVGNEPPPPAPTDYAADGLFDQATMQRSRDQLRREHGGSRNWSVMLNLGEWQVRDGEDGYRWDGEAWFGGDLNRLVIKSEGEGEAGSGVESGDVQILFSRAITPYYDLQAGIRQDIQRGPKRTYLTVGFEGLAPYWFETEGALFLSDEGELSARLEGSYDLRLTQRWILQPRGELNFSAEDIPELGLGSGVSNVELGLRLRYEFRREFAPYVGVAYERKVGETGDMAKAMGNDRDSLSLVLGVRTWF